jgi:hypothetical protein
MKVRRGSKRAFVLVTVLIVIMLASMARGGNRRRGWIRV